VIVFPRWGLPHLRVNQEAMSDLPKPPLCMFVVQRPCAFSSFSEKEVYPSNENSRPVRDVSIVRVVIRRYWRCNS